MQLTKVEIRNDKDYGKKSELCASVNCAMQRNSIVANLGVCGVLWGGMLWQNRGVQFYFWLWQYRGSKF